MRKIVSSVIAIAFLCVTAIGAFALNDEVASISYIDKQVDPKKPKEQGVNILRNATRLADKDIDFGTTLQNFDVIKTGARSQVEITIYAKTGIDAVLTVKPSTTMTIDITSLKAEQKGAITLLAGSIDLKVKKMTGSNQLSVKTTTANMGVRGTQFEVSYAESGDVLLMTREGRVECTTDDGKVLFSAPGAVVQGTYDGSWDSVPVAVDKIEDFKKQWHAKRIAAFKANPVRATRQFALLYLRHKDNFNKYYGEVMANRDLIQKWIQQDNAGNVGSAADQAREKVRLMGGLMKVRRVVVLFERVYYRLLQLDELYSQGIVPKGWVKPGMTIDQFYQLFRNDQADIERKFADLQYLAKLYAKRNDGVFPLDEAKSTDLIEASTPPSDAGGVGQTGDGGDDFFKTE